MNGLYMVNPESLKFFLGGHSLEDMDMANLGNVSSWKRSITSYKKQLPSCMVINSELQ